MEDHKKKKREGVVLFLKFGNGVTSEKIGLARSDAD